MWVWGMVVGAVAFVGGAALSIQAFLEAQGFGGMLPGLVLVEVGSALFWGFLVWGLAFRPRTTKD